MLPSGMPVRPDTVLVTFSAVHGDPYPRDPVSGAYCDATHDKPLAWGPTLRAVADRRSPLYGRVSDVYYRCNRRRPGYPRCQAPAPREEQVTADIESALERIQLAEPLARWVLEFVDLWLEEQSESIAARTKATRAELEQVEHRLKRLTDLVVDGHIAEDEFSARRGKLQSRAVALRAALDNPTQELERWRETITNVVSVGQTLHDAFMQGDLAARRQLLSQVCSNLVVKDRKAAPVLRSEYLVLTEQPTLASGENSDGSNLPPPRQALLNLRKNSRPTNRRQREFLAWYARRESNPHPRFRRPVFYPLNHGR